MNKQTAVEWLEKEVNGTFYVAQASEMAKRFKKIFEEAKAMEREQIEQALPSKDDAVNFGFRKAINSDYNCRKVCKDSDDDLYYSGWMDCYDWLNETYQRGEQ